MAVTFHNATVTAGPASVGAATFVHTISAAGACLLVFTHANTAISISAMAANGNALTRLGHISASSSRAEVWGLSSAPLGNLGISANVVGAASLGFCLVAVSYTGQRQFGGSPFGTVVAGTAHGVAAVAFSISSTTTDIVSFGFGISANTTITLNTGTSRGNTTHSVAGRLVVGDIAGQAAFSISATAAAAGTWSFLGVPIVASAAAAATTLVFDNKATTASSGAVGSMGMLLTATSGAVLLVWTISDQNRTMSAVNVNTNSLTFLGGVENAGPLRVELWGLTAPPTGILTISAATVAANTGGLGMGAVTYVGQRTTATPFGGVTIASAAAALSFNFSVSADVGNLIVAGFGTRAFNTVNYSAIPGMTQQLTGTAYPAIIIADTPGGPAITVGAILSVVSAHLGIAINLIQSGPATFITGRLSATDVTDKFSASGYVVVTGRLSATDVTDKFSASGYVIVNGRLSATGAADRLSATGYVVVSGRLSAREAFADTFSASGYTIVSGRLSAREALADTFSASGYNIVSGRMSATDAADIFSASGNVIALGATLGRLSATDAADTFSASGYVIVSGSVNFTDRPDIFSASGTVIAVSAPAVVVTPDTTSIGGKKDKKTEYFRADDAFWDAREKYLISLQPAISAEPEPAPTIHAELPNTVPSPVDPSLLIQYRATRAKLVQSIPDATTMRQLQARGKRLYEVNARIAEQKRLQALADEQQRITLARLAKEARQRKRVQDISRIKRRVVILAAARAAVALTYLLDKL